MADTGRPETPTRKLFKASSKTKTPPAKRVATTPSSAHSSPKSSRPGPTLFRKPSGTTPKLVRKASSHTAHIPTTPTKPATDDIVDSTSLAPLTTRSGITQGDTADSPASDTTGRVTPIGLIDNDALTPTDTVSRRTDAARARSRTMSDTMTGAAGGSPSHDSTRLGSGNEKSETGKKASNDVLQRAPTPGGAVQKASEHGNTTNPFASRLPQALSGKTDGVDDPLPSADYPLNTQNRPRDLVKYFLDQGHSEMSEFVRALTASQEEPASTANTAVDSSQAQEVGKADAHKPSNTVSNPREKAETPESAAKRDSGPQSTSKTQGARETAQGPTKEVADRLGDISEVSREQIDHRSASNTAVSDPGRKALDTANQASGIATGFPDVVSFDVVEELPTNDKLVAGPTSKTQDTPAVPRDITEKPTSEAVSSSPDVSQNSVEELPTDDDLIIAPPDKVQDTTEAAGLALSEAHEEEQATANKVEMADEQRAGDISQPIADSQQAAGDAARNNIAIPEMENTTRGKDVVSGAAGKALNVKDTSFSQGKDRAGQKASFDESPDQLSSSDVLSKAIQKPIEPAGDTASAAAGADTSNPAQNSQELTNGAATSSMLGAKDGLASSATQNSDVSNETGQAQGPGSGIQVHADNMGQPTKISKRMEIPLPIPDRPSPSQRPSMQMPEVDNLKSTADLPNPNDLDDPPEEFLDPSMHTPLQRSVNIPTIPKVSKVTPITEQPPPDLPQLAQGLGGCSVDDVGNIVDESGKVLGHATGDLPSMVGKKVAENGEVYGDSGELIGFVTENFTGQSAPPKEKEDEGFHVSPLPNGLRVDINGNILDGSGHVIGKLHNKPEQPSNAITPYTGKVEDEAKTQTDGEKDKPDGDKPRAKFDEGGIPADIFLDVKSTPDGIQLTIRIPTIFKQETRQTTS